MNIEGYNRNKFYLSKVISDYKPMFIFLQEHWLPDYETSNKLSRDFLKYRFLTTSADMFTASEDKMLESGPIWHGTALGWTENVDKHIYYL